MPDTLFICKLHPAHDYEPSAFASMPVNVIVIDEFVSLYADLSIPRLIKACDAVVCTQSTVALEAAIAQKPLLVLDTENPNHYEGIVVSEIEQLTNSIRTLLHTGQTEYPKFLDAYYNAPDPSNALSNVLEAITDSFRATQPQASGRDIAIAAFARSFLLEIEARNQAETECERLRSELQRLPQVSPENPVFSQPSPSIASEPPAAEAIEQVSDHPTTADVGDQVASVVPPPQSEVPCSATPSGVIPASVQAEGGPFHGPAPTVDSVELGLGKITVDRWSDHHNDAECQHACNVLNKHGTRSSILRMSFHEAIEIFADDSFEFIYIDGYAHTRQYGINTLDTWWRKLKSGGMFAGHDYHSLWPATVAVVDEFVAKHGVALYTTSEDPSLVEHAHPTWYTIKPLVL